MTPCSVHHEPPCSPWRCRSHARRKPPRRGATMIEMAIVGPLVFLLVIGLIVAALGVFRLHQVGRLAHEGARWASIHGSEWERATGNSAVTANDVFRQAMLPIGQGLNADRLEHTVTWNEDRTDVQVTVRFRWLPEAFMSGGVITATSVRPISY